MTFLKMGKNQERHISMSKNKKKKKLYPFTNDIVFCVSLGEHPEMAKKVIETILGNRIPDLTVANAQQIKNLDLEDKFVRFDVYAIDDDDTRYDIEMQTSYNHNLAKRIRYYHAANTLGTRLLGKDYTKLPKSFVIFICSFDPFKKGDALYKFSTMSEKYHDELDYNDGVITYILNAAANDSSISPELQEFLNYVRTGIPAEDGLTAELQELVVKLNDSNKWRNNMSTLEEIRQDAELKGIEKGKAAGKEENNKKIALRMLKNGEDISKIKAYTELSKEEIENLKRQLN